MEPLLFRKLFYHIRENQLFYKTYFKLRPTGQLKMIGYDANEAAACFGGQNIEYHIEFFGNGLNAVIQMWLKRNCRETPEEICAILESEYTGRRKALQIEGESL